MKKYALQPQVLIREKGEKCVTKLFKITNQEKARDIIE